MRVFLGWIAGPSHLPRGLSSPPQLRTVRPRCCPTDPDHGPPDADRLLSVRWRRVGGGDMPFACHASKPRGNPEEAPLSALGGARCLENDRAPGAGDRIGLGTTSEAVGAVRFSSRMEGHRMEERMKSQLPPTRRILLRPFSGCSPVVSACYVVSPSIK